MKCDLCTLKLQCVETREVENTRLRTYKCKTPKCNRILYTKEIIVKTLSGVTKQLKKRKKRDL